ncbi:MAG: radical SAM protein [Candidatus Wallbacteria bacterium]
MDYRFELLNQHLKKNETYLIKPPRGHIKTCVVYPNSYEIGMASLAFHFTYSYFCAYPEFCVERAFLPDKKSMPLILTKYLPSFETLTPLMNFNILAFSISYEPDFINVLKILKYAKIPLRASDRRNAPYPLVICGGPINFQNIIPMAEVFDIFCVGNGETALPEFIKSYINNYGRCQTIEEINYKTITELSSASNILSQPVSIGSGRSFTLGCEVKTRPQYAKTAILSANNEFASRAIIEVQRGCVRRCRFCMVGNCYGRFRFNEYSEIIEYVEKTSAFTHKFGLLGPAVTAHPQINQLYDYFKDKKFDVSMSSIYADELNDNALKILSESDQKNVTAGIESADYEIRKISGKNLTDEAIKQSFAAALNSGIKTFKLYLILGLYDYFEKSGSEADDTTSFLTDLAGFIKSKKSDAKLKISFNPLILKPRTPLYENLKSGKFLEKYRSSFYIDELNERYEKIAKNLKSVSNIEFSEKNFDDAKVLKYLTDCTINLFDFFNDFFYNEPVKSKALIKTFAARESAFDILKVKEKLFGINFFENE